MRLTVIIHDLELGGAQRVATGLANHWAASGHAVELLTFTTPDTRPFFALDPRILHRSLGISGTRLDRRLLRLRKALAHKPDVVISFMEEINIYTALAAVGTSIPVVACERSHPLLNRPGRLRKVLRSLCYCLVRKVVFQTRRTAETVALPAVRRTVLPNPLFGVLPSAPAPDCRRLLGIGRLAPEKGFDRLIAAFASLQDRFPAWRLTLCGDGPSRMALERQVRSLGLTDRVEFLGAYPAAEVMAEGGVFVLPSRYEGFPNVLIEAMSWGLPAVAFDCPAGPGEILRHGEDGLLVTADDVAALAAALALVMADPCQRSRLGQAAWTSARRFAGEHVLVQWDALLASVTGGTTS